MTARHDFATVLGLPEPPPLPTPELGSARVIRHQPYNLVVWKVQGFLSKENGDLLLTTLWAERHPKSGKALTLWGGDTEQGLRMTFGHVVCGGWWSDVKKVLDRHVGGDEIWSYEEVVRWPLPAPARHAEMP